MQDAQPIRYSPAMIPVIQKRTHWTCPYCPLEEVTTEERPHSRVHPCPGKQGMLIPMVEKGVKAHIRMVEREDYVGQENVRLQAGRPIMAAITEREDGQDVHVFAPTAIGRDLNGR